MAYTFGGATTDGIDFTGMLSASMNTNRVGLCVCWVRPTTLTANRALWGQGAASGLVVGGTTSQTILVADTATIDWNVTFPTGLAVNTWSFVATLWNLGASTVAAARQWIATETTRPVEVTGTVTSGPTGAWVGSGTTFTAGNGTGGSLAFQGDAGGYSLFVDSQNSTLNSICSIPANGAITNDQAALVKVAMVDKLWRGDILALAGAGRQVYGTTGLGFFMSASLDNGAAGGAWALRGDRAPTRGTVTGATVSARRTPRSFDDNNHNQMNRGRTGYLVRT